MVVVLRATKIIVASFEFRLLLAVGKLSTRGPFYHSRIMAVCNRDKLVMSADFDHFALLDERDDVGIPGAMDGEQGLMAPCRYNMDSPDSS